MKEEKGFSTNGSLDCCDKKEIEKNKKKHLECTICHNTGFLSPITKKEKELLKKQARARKARAYHNGNLMEMNKFTWEEFEGLEGFHYAYYDKVELGFIEFWKPWKKWVWNQNENVVMSLDCMEEVCKKINSQNLSRR